MPSRDPKINIQPVADGENKSSPVAPPLPTDTGNGSSGHLVLPPPSDSASPTSVRSAGSNNSSGTLSIFGQSPASPATLSTKRSLRRKLVVIGDGAAGKTSLLVAYKHGTFRPEYLPTVFENSTTSVPVESKTVELALWDTAGQEDYDRLRPLSYPDSHVILICYAVDKPQSLRNVYQKWVHELDQYCPHVPRILVGCKADLRPASLQPHETEHYTTSEAARAVAQQIGAVSSIECSSLTRMNVDEVFAQAARVSLTFQARRGRRKSSSEPGSRRRRCLLQ